ncbi:TetR/AcrR family transcriptional regulator C-terminal domain-containing protein [Agromyces sp. PvR057]|uniref:TetR/AcrR family transcriptional regulator C-terminal domain-containing protein n=1 Tax=Agromyces sp. PvR057 TaxID=3156403 RepID=UPI000E22B4CE
MTEPKPDPELPRGVALAWGVAAHPQRGPKRELSIERIVEVAIEIADAEGLGAVSMSRVASTLGFTTMSLYRYVTSKDDLILLMQEAASELPVPDAAIEHGWREGVTSWVLGIRAGYQAHPWLVDIPISGAPLTPNSLMIVDWFLREVRTLPLDDGEKMATLLLCTSYARATSAQDRDIARAVEAGAIAAATAEQSLSALMELVTPERFPDLSPLFRAGSYAEPSGVDAVAPDTATDFVFGLERILDGIETYVARHATGAPGAGGSAERAADLAGDDVASILALEPPRDKDVREAAKARREAEKAVREAEKALREAQKRERDAVKRARERSEREQDRESREREREQREQERLQRG